MKFLNSDTKYYTFVQMLKLAELDGRLYGMGPFTVFVPTNDAFGKIPSQELADLLENMVLLKPLMKRHILLEEYSSTSLLKERYLLTMSDLEITIKSKDHYAITVNNAQIIKADIFVDNGVLHIIDSIIETPKVIAAI